MLHYYVILEVFVVSLQIKKTKQRKAALKFVKFLEETQILCRNVQHKIFSASHKLPVENKHH